MKTVNCYPHVIMLLTISAFSFQLSAFSQGPLTPPGMPTPTMKSLDQIEARTPISSAPYMINASGSYYLTNNVTVSSGDAITINVSDVDLDLNGFTISSTAASATGTGILIAQALVNIGIHDGSIQSGVQQSGGTFSGSGFANGISINGAGPPSTHISNVRVSGVLNFGIAVGGLVESCTVLTAGGTGIFASVI